MTIISALPYLDPTYVHQPTAYILKRFLKKYRIDINSFELHQHLIEHPYFPSLLSISDILNSINVPNHAYKIDLETLKINFENQIMIHLKLDGGLFCILEKINERNFKIITEKGETIWLDENKFKEVWEGVVLDIEISDEVKIFRSSHHTSYPVYLKYIIASFWGGIIFYLLRNQSLNLNPTQAFMLILNITGVLISWLLVLQSLNKDNFLVQQLCQSDTKEGCNSVLNNKFAQLTSWLSMADAGLIYFSGCAISLLAFYNSELTYVLTLLGPIFSIYAIYLQAFVIKQWCRLCMAAHAVILLAFLLTISTIMGRSPTLPTVGEMIIFLVPGMIWLLIKPYIIKIKEVQHYQSENGRLKNDVSIFSTLIQNEGKLHIPETFKVLNVGNINAIHELTIILSPSCGPCADAFSVINDWSKEDLDFKISLIFVHTNDKTGSRKGFVNYLIGIKTPQDLLVALDGWYKSSNKQVHIWAKQFKLQYDELDYSEQELDTWLETSSVDTTPAFFIDGFKLPKIYQLKNIRFLINEMPETECS